MLSTGTSLGSCSFVRVTCHLDMRHRMKPHHHTSPQPRHYLPPSMSPLQTDFLNSSTQSATEISCTAERASSKEVLLKYHTRERKEHSLLQLHPGQKNNISSMVQAYKSANRAEELERSVQCWEEGRVNRKKKPRLSYAWSAKTWGKAMVWFSHDSDAEAEHLNTCIFL